jgi:site-specific DNA-methyltransferase (adenine-specific)
LISLVPKKAKSSKRRAFYKSPPPKPLKVGSSRCDDRTAQRAVPTSDLPHAHPVAPSHFTLREDGSIGTPASGTACSKQPPNAVLEAGAPPSTAPRMPSGLNSQPSTLPRLIFSSEKIWLYCGNCLELLDAIAAKYPDGRFDAIFADPPYFLSNPESFRGCQRVLKPNGTIWVTGTHHVIFSIGYALQQIGFKILNDIAWEKPNPPPNLSCRYFTHSTETVLWAAKNEKSKHVFNYQEMRKVTGKQMKTVWRAKEWGDGLRDKWIDENNPNNPQIPNSNNPVIHQSTNPALDPIWTLSAPSTGEKSFGKHPTQKPVALVERCLLASTNEGDLVLDPFLGNGTTAVANAIRRLGKTEFTTADAYVFTRELEQLHPDNRHVRDKIRQQLQVLRDLGLLLHLGRGEWRLP